MKNTNKIAVIFTFLIIAFINKSEAISCVQCTACSNPYNNVTNPVSACATGLDTCLKSAIVYVGGSLVQKGCVSASSCSSASVAIAGYGFWLTCCSTDGCNNSNFNRPVSILVFALPILCSLKRTLFEN